MTEINEINVHTLKKWLENNEVILIDVRQPQEYNIQRINQAINIPLSIIDKQHINNAENSGKKIVLQCRIGVRSMTACRKIFDPDHSVEIYNLEGGITSWIQNELPIIEMMPDTA